MKRFADVAVLEEEVEGPPEKLPLVETWAEAYPTKIYPEPYETTSKTLKFEIKARKENWFIPSDIEFHTKLRPRNAAGARATNPTGAGNGAGVHIRFINDYASWLIKAIRVKPKGQHDIEIASPYISFAESLRSDFQTSKEEKEHPELLYTRGYDPKINYNPHKDKVGFAKSAPDAEEKVIKAFEQYQYDLEWVPITIKPLPGFFHEIHKALPSLMDYELEIELQSDEFMLISRVGADDGDGAVNAATYQVHTTETFLLIDYKSMGPEEDQKLEKEIFTQPEILFDTFDKIRLVFGETISENNTAEGVQIRNWTALDGEIPDQFFFGLVDAGTVMNPSRLEVPGQFEAFNCTKIQLYINDIPIFKKGHINWVNNRANRHYIWSTQCDMVAELGDSKRENIGNFPLDKIPNGRWFAYVNLTANRKKGIANTVRKFDGVFTARVWFSATNAAARRQLVIGWFERGELNCVNPIDNGWAPKHFKELPTKIPIRFSNVGDGVRT